MLFISTIIGLNIVTDTCVSFDVCMLSRPWAFSTGHCRGLSSSKEEVGEVGSHDFPSMLHILHRNQRPPSGGGRSQPGTYLNTWCIAVGHNKVLFFFSHEQWIIKKYNCHSDKKVSEWLILMPKAYSVVIVQWHLVWKELTWVGLRIVWTSVGCIVWQAVHAVLCRSVCGLAEQFPNYWCSTLLSYPEKVITGSPRESYGGFSRSMDCCYTVRAF